MSLRGRHMSQPASALAATSVYIPGSDECLHPWQRVFTPQRSGCMRGGECPGVGPARSFACSDSKRAAVLDSLQRLIIKEPEYTRNPGGNCPAQEPETSNMIVHWSPATEGNRSHLRACACVANTAVGRISANHFLKTSRRRT